MLAPHRRDLFMLPSAVLVTVPRAAVAQGPLLGTVRFSTSARSPETKAHFECGIAALHSFCYPVALEDFRAARRLEPGFAMALWGEAMAHNHPVWGDPQDTEAARRVLAQLLDGPVPGITTREQGYIDAVRALYGPGERPARDRSHAEAMARLSAQHPDDLEAAAFHALALLGVAYGSGGTEMGAPRAGEGLRLRMRAGAIVQEVWRRAAEHPGAAHYIPHAFDDPDHAVLALPAARRPVVAKSCCAATKWPARAPRGTEPAGSCSGPGTSPPSRCWTSASCCGPATTQMTPPSVRFLPAFSPPAPLNHPPRPGAAQSRWNSRTRP